MTRIWGFVLLFVMLVLSALPTAAQNRQAQAQADADAEAQSAGNTIGTGIAIAIQRRRGQKQDEAKIAYCEDTPGGAVDAFNMREMPCSDFLARAKAVCEVNPKAKQCKWWAKRDGGTIK